MQPPLNFQKNLAAASALAGFLAVLCGAFGAHALRNKVPPEMLAAFETGARYQMFHALAGLALAGLAASWGAQRLRAVALLWASGTILFSGSLYLLVLTGGRFWGAVTPLGGLLLMAGWLSLAVRAFQKSPD